MYSLKSALQIAKDLTFTGPIGSSKGTDSSRSATSLGHVRGSYTNEAQPRYQSEVDSTLLVHNATRIVISERNLGGPVQRGYLFTLLRVVFALVLTGCGGGNNSVTAASQSGNVTIQTGDAVNDQVVK